MEKLKEIKVDWDSTTEKYANEMNSEKLYKQATEISILFETKNNTNKVIALNHFCYRKNDK